MFTVLARNSKSLLSTGPLGDLKQSVSPPLTLNPHPSKEEDRVSIYLLTASFAAVMS